MDYISLVFLLLLVAMVIGFVVAVIRGKRSGHIHQGKGDSASGWIPGMDGQDSSHTSHHHSGHHHHNHSSGSLGHHGGHDIGGGHHGGGGGDMGGGHHH